MKSVKSRLMQILAEEGILPRTAAAPWKVPTDRKVVYRVGIEDPSEPEIRVEFTDGSEIIYDWPARSWRDLLMFYNRGELDLRKIIQDLLDHPEAKPRLGGAHSKAATHYAVAVDMALEAMLANQERLERHLPTIQRESPPWGKAVSSAVGHMKQAIRALQSVVPD